MLGFMARLVASVAILTVAFALGWPGAADAQSLKTGDRVKIGSTGDLGVVLQIGQATPEGGVMVKVRLDRPGATEADREVWYNSRPARVELAGPGAVPGTTPAAPATPSPAAADKKAPFDVGDRVKIGSLDVTGTVTQLGGVLGNGAQMIRIAIDKDAKKYPGQSNWYDTLSSRIVPAAN